MFFPTPEPSTALETRVRVSDAVPRCDAVPSVLRDDGFSAERAGWQSVINKIHNMSIYQDDWDGLDSPAPSPAIIASAIEFMEHLRGKKLCPPPDRVAATPSGTIGLEWQKPGFYMEAEITIPGHSEWMLVRGGDRPRHWTW